MLGLKTNHAIVIKCQISNSMFVVIDASNNYLLQLTQFQCSSHGFVRKIPNL
jgi:hypothetical protein